MTDVEQKVIIELGQNIGLIVNPRVVDGEPGVAYDGIVRKEYHEACRDLHIFNQQTCCA